MEEVMKRLLFSIFVLLFAVGCEINFNRKVDDCKDDCRVVTILNIDNCMGQQECITAAIIQHEWCRDSCESVR